MQVKIFNLRLNAAHTLQDQEEMNAFLKGKDFKKSSTQFVEGEENFWSVLVHFEEGESTDAPPAKSGTQSQMPFDVPPAAPKTEKAPPPAEVPLTPEEDTIYQTLRHWRQTKAEASGLPVFIVAHNSELMEIARLRPQTLEILSEIKGFGPQKLEKYGEEILAVLNAL